MTDKIVIGRAVVKQALDALLEPMGFTGSRQIDAKLHAACQALRAALAQQDAQAVPQGYKLVPVAADIEVRRHLEGKSGADFLLAYADWCRPAAAPTPPAPKPLGWLDRKAVECLQGAELSWMPAWNRPTSSDPVPIFLLPPAQRVMLTDEEVIEVWTDIALQENGSGWHAIGKRYARAVIEAYEIKNGLKP